MFATRESLVSIPLCGKGRYRQAVMSGKEQPLMEVSIPLCGKGRYRRWP